MASYGILGNADKMEKAACIFGIEFRTERIRRNISLWKIVHATKGYLATLQRIEKGLTQPGVENALRLLTTINVNPGDFLQELVRKYPTQFPVSASPTNINFLKFTQTSPGEKPKFLFGPLLRQVRVSCNISQREMAKRAQYNIRNINAVENGVQEPGIITAITLVAVTGFDIKIFFSQLYEIWQIGKKI